MLYVQVLQNLDTVLVYSVCTVLYTVNQKKGSSTFVIITLDNLDRFL